MEEGQVYVPWIMTLLENPKLGADPVELCTYWADWSATNKLRLMMS